jgi:hypothetical protein
MSTAWDKLVVGSPAGTLPVPKAALQELLGTLAQLDGPGLCKALKWSIDALLASLGKPPFTHVPPPAFVQAAVLVDAVLRVTGAAVHTALPTGGSPYGWASTIEGLGPPLPSVAIAVEVPALKAVYLPVLQLPQLTQQLPVVVTAYLKDATERNRDPRIVHLLLRAVFLGGRAITFPLKGLLESVDRLFLYRRGQKVAPGQATIDCRRVSMALSLTQVDAAAPDFSMKLRQLLRLPPLQEPSAAPVALHQPPHSHPQPTTAAAPPTKAPSSKQAAAVKQAMAAAASKQPGGAKAPGKKPQPTPAGSGAGNNPPAATIKRPPPPAAPTVYPKYTTTKRKPSDFFVPAVLEVLLAWTRSIVDAPSRMAAIALVGDCITTSASFRQATGTDSGFVQRVLEALGPHFKDHILRPAMLLPSIGAATLPLLLASMARHLSSFQDSKTIFTCAHQLSECASPSQLDECLTHLGLELDRRAPAKLVRLALSAWAERVTWVQSGEGAGSSAKGGNNSKTGKAAAAGGGASTSKYPLLDKAAQTDDQPAALVAFVLCVLATAIQSQRPLEDCATMGALHLSVVLNALIAAVAVQDWRAPSESDKAQVAVSAALAAWRSFVVFVVNRCSDVPVVLPTSVSDAVADFVTGVSLRVAARNAAAVAPSVPTQMPVVSSRLCALDSNIVSTALVDVARLRWMSKAAGATVWNACAKVAPWVVSDKALAAVAANSLSAAGTEAEANGPGAKQIILNGLRCRGAAYADWLVADVRGKGNVDTAFIEAAWRGLGAAVGQHTDAQQRVALAAFAASSAVAVLAAFDLNESSAWLAAGPNGPPVDAIAAQYTAFAADVAHQPYQQIAVVCEALADLLARCEAVRGSREGAEADRKRTEAEREAQRRQQAVLEDIAREERLRAARLASAKAQGDAERRDSGARLAARERVAERSEAAEAAALATAERRAAALQALRRQADAAAATERDADERRHARAVMCNAAFVRRKALLKALGVPDAKANEVAFRFLRHPNLSDQALLEFLVGGKAEEPADVIQRLKKSEHARTQRAMFTDDVTATGTAPAFADPDDFWGSLGVTEETVVARQKRETETAAHQDQNDTATGHATDEQGVEEAWRASSVHERLSLVLDAFDYQTDDETGGLVVPPLQIAALKAAYSDARDVRMRTGFETIRDVAEAASVRGLLTIRGGYAALTSLGCAYHRAYVDADRAVSRRLDAAREALKARLHLAGGVSMHADPADLDGTLDESQNVDMDAPDYDDAVSVGSETPSDEVADARRMTMQFSDELF